LPIAGQKPRTWEVIAAIRWQQKDSFTVLLSRKLLTLPIDFLQVFLVIDRDRVASEIRDEGADPHNLFPHIYGELNIDAVVKAIDLETDTDGLFVMPKELEN
jgi:Protein of unknown function (DUF952)